MPNETFKFVVVFAIVVFLQTFPTKSIAEPIPQTDWSLLSVDSEELIRENGAAVNAFDGDINTIWHTAWSSNTTTHPHTIDIYLGGSYELNGFRYLPRQDGSDNGRINQYEFYVSNDGINWGTPTASGSFVDSAVEQEALFTAPETGAFVRLVALSSYDGDPWTTVAEITMLGDLASGNQPADGMIDTPGSDLAINVGDSLNFTGTGTDIEGDLPLTYLWNFGAGSGIPDAYVEDPGSVQFDTEGIFNVSFTVTDSLGQDDPTPDVRIITVGNQAPDGSIDTPATDLTINVGDSLTFTATSSDPDGDLPLTYLWNFGAGSGIPDANSEDPGMLQFNTAGSFTVSFTVTDVLGLADPIPDVRIITVQTAPSQPIPQTDWSLLSVDSEELIRENGAAVNAFDGDINTIWHTAWSSNTTTHPHTIDIYLGGSYELNGFRYRPRQDGGDNGRINQYEFYVSNDGINWGTPTASGNFVDSAVEQEALFTAPETGAFVRLVALSSYDGDPWTTVAEITMLGDLASGNQPADGMIDTPGSDLAINVGDSLNFTGTGTDIEGDLPLTYLWNFGAGSGIPDAYVEDPGSVRFDTEGIFNVSFTVTDSLGQDDPTPDVRIITVGNQAPDGSIDTPATDLTINVGDSLTFTATSSDPDGDLPLTYLWNFGAGSGIPDANIEDPGLLQFNTAGSFTVSFTVTDDLGAVDPTPATRIVTVRSNESPIIIPDWSSITKPPFNIADPININNPVLTASDVTDVQAEFVADPFLYQEETGALFMFFEVMNTQSGLGEIGVATSENAMDWTYDRIVLNEGFHMSYPYVFSVDGRHYMVPETSETQSVRIYEATNFPYDWNYVATLISGRYFVDPSIFYFNNYWWMFVSAGNDGYLYYSNDLLSGWTEHPDSPIVENDASHARSGGRSFVFDNDRIVRLVQKGDITYGEQIRAYEIDVLTTTTYTEHEVAESPLLMPSGVGWNAFGMHHYDPLWIGNQWVGAVDGTPDNDYRSWSIGIFTTQTAPSQPILQTDWSLLSVDSEELVRENGAAVNAFDGDINTIWHTAWSSNTTAHPHTIEIYLGGSYDLNGFRYLPRQDGGDNGRINQYEFYVSNDGINWGTPAASGNFADSAVEQEALFAAPETGAFVRLVALSSYDGDPWTTVAEITVLGDLASGNQPADGMIDTPGSDLAINVGDTLDFTGTGSDIEGDLPLTYLWNFGAGSGIPDAYVEDPGPVRFDTEGIFNVSFTVTDSLGQDDPTPDVRIITVGNQAPDGSIDTPATDLTINVGDSLNFTATSSDPDGNLPLTYLWSFGAGSGIPDANSEDPGMLQFNTAGSFTVSFSVTDVLGLADPIPDVRIITVLTAPPQPIPQTGWSLLSVDSEELVGENGAAVNAFDGDINTIWHTAWSSNATTHPHTIEMYLGGSYDLNGFRYLPRQDGGDNGRINQYEFYVSNDGINWGAPAASGNFVDSAVEQEALFTAPETGAFVRLVALSSYDGDPWTTVAEITVLGDLASGNQPPDSIIDAPGSDLAVNVGDSLDFSGTGSDIEGDLPLTYLWNFGAGSGIPDAYVEDPGPVRFDTEGIFNVSFTVTDSLGLHDSTPDNRMITVCTAPSVLLLKPNDLHIQSSVDLYVAADTCLDSTLHAGWSVRFTVTDSRNIIVATFDDFSAPYEVNFAGLSKSEHTVDATILDEFGSEVSGVNTSDQATQIGIGDYYVAFGDSITYGLRDDILSDDTSLDGRNLFGGFTPILNDLLTTANGYPHTVINRGIGGDTTADGLLRLPFILSNNPEAQYYLIMFGTNDAGSSPIPSGQGLIEGQSGYIGSFKDNVNQMITLINNAGKTVYLAKTLYAKGTFVNRNTLIQEYNLVIDELALENDISITPPDFYTFFFNNQDQYIDDLHPNGTGYQSMANIWFNLLSP